MNWILSPLPKLEGFNHPENVLERAVFEQFRLLFFVPFIPHPCDGSVNVISRWFFLEEHDVVFIVLENVLFENCGANRSSCLACDLKQLYVSCLAFQNALSSNDA